MQIARSSGLAFLIFAMSALLLIGRFDQFFVPTAMGDDLGSMLTFIHGGFSSTFWSALTDEFVGRYRPFFQVGWWAIQSTFGPSMWAFYTVNIILNAIACVFFFLMCHRLARGVIAVSLFALLAFTWSRFFLFQIVTASGLIETAGMLFFMISLWAMLKVRTASRRGQFQLGLAAAAAIFAATYSHERYIVVAFIYAAMFWFLAGSCVAGRRTVIIGLLALTPSSNIFLKTVVFGGHFLVGSGSAGPMAFDLGGSVQSLFWALSSLAGFNDGLQSFMGESYRTFPTWLLYVAAVIPLGFVASIIAAVRHINYWKKGARSLEPLLLCAVSAALLAPAVATFPLQSRWLIEPAGVVLIWLSASTVPLIPIIVSLASVVLEQATPNVIETNIYVAAARQTDGVKKAFTAGSLSGANPIRLVIHPDFCGWIVQYGGLFEIYGSQARPVECIPNFEAAQQAPIDPNSPIFHQNWQGAYEELDPGINSELTARFADAQKFVGFSELTDEQRLGGVALWLKTTGKLDPDTLASIDGQAVSTRVGQNYITVMLPPKWLTKGVHELRLTAVRGGKTAVSKPSKLIIE